ncbi:hypothetical protein DD238_007053 [Peronospora effusa]|uniref:Uncharacterized protein n=1 Tax=Peronospora effusa TaxID=542832 RepID=A0A3M6VDM4_9STRA|nr:hypothetical protein DD238_007053 [Peronospora effusa]RQM10749.1 hypothetical protein DD237_006981 [Peronospora effusa]
MDGQTSVGSSNLNQSEEDVPLKASTIIFLSSSPQSLGRKPFAALFHHKSCEFKNFFFAAIGPTFTIRPSDALTIQGVKL